MPLACLPNRPPADHVSRYRIRIRPQNNWHEAAEFDILGV
jgi:hypothetical protein